MDSICLFAGFNANGKIEDYVVYYVKELSKFADVYYLSDCYTQDSELEKLKPFVKKAYSYRHEKYDFGSWQELINKIGYEKLQKYKNLILCNDSCFGPLFDIHQICNEMNARGCDFWGITKNNYLGIIHIQSYFMSFKKNVFMSDIFMEFFKSVKKEASKYDVVMQYELTLTNILSKSGFKYLSYIDEAKIYKFILKYEFTNNLDACLYWKQAIKLGCPFIKKYIYTYMFNSIYKDPFRGGAN